MASKRNYENREQAPELVPMRATWGDVRDVIPEMVAVLEEQGWCVINQESTNEEEESCS
jgi:hypothetical protein